MEFLTLIRELYRWPQRYITGPLTIGIILLMIVIFGGCSTLDANDECYHVNVLGQRVSPHDTTQQVWEVCP